VLNFFLKFLTFALHAPVIFLIYYLWKPISEWYLSQVPALGVDLYLSATFVSYHLKKINFPYNSFLDFWFSGFPLISTYPQLAFYLMVPFGAKFGSVEGVRVFAMFSVLLISVFSYLLFFRLSRNHGIALLLALAVLFSPNIYGSAIWAGSIPYLLSMAFFPLALFFATRYLENPTLGRLSLVSLVAGLAVMINPLSVLAFTIPAVFIIIFFAGRLGRLSLIKSAGHFVFFNFGLLGSSFTVTYSAAFTFIRKFSLPGLGVGRVAPQGGESPEAARGAAEIASFYKGLIPQLYTRTEPFIFEILVLGLAVAAIALIFRNKKKKIYYLLPFILIALWTGVHPAINLGNIFGFLRHDPYRAFWQFTIAAGALAAVLCGNFFNLLSDRFNFKYKSLLIFGVGLAISAIFGFFAWGHFNKAQSELTAVLEANSEYSSAFPEALSIGTKKEDQEKLKAALVPSFMDPNDRNSRLYEADATVNIWWKTFFDKPLVRGYLDPPIGLQNRWGIFLLDVSIANDTLVRDFKVSEKVALNNALFFIDWYAVRFFEGGRISSKGPSVGPSSYLLSNNVFDKEEEVTAYGGVLKWQTASGKPEVVFDLPQKLRFFKVADQYSSNVVSATNASPILVFSSEDGFDDVMRVLASLNLNSKKVVPVKGAVVDEFSKKELGNFDAVILSASYKYKNSKRAFTLLEEYVKGGGKLFIDTGGEVKESSGSNLPEVIPFEEGEREMFGREPQLNGEGKFLDAVDLSGFGPLVFDDLEWKLAVPVGNLRDNSKVILSHKDVPIMIERTLGHGRIIWSGMNFFYHYNQYQKEEEAKLFANILKDFVDLSEKKSSQVSVNFENSEKVNVELLEKSRGVLFKEEYYPGWKAASGRENLKIYPAGPTFPGFMYVPLKSRQDSATKVTFKYTGTKLFWTVGFLNLLSILVLLDMGLGAKTLSRLFVLLFAHTRGRLFKWWQREEEE